MIIDPRCNAGLYLYYELALVQAHLFGWHRLLCFVQRTAMGVMETAVRLQARDKIRADDASGGDGEYAHAGAIAGVGVNLASSAAGEFD